MELGRHQSFLVFFFFVLQKVLPWLLVRQLILSPGYPEMYLSPAEWCADAFL